MGLILGAVAGGVVLVVAAIGIYVVINGGGGAAQQQAAGNPAAVPEQPASANPEGTPTDAASDGPQTATNTEMTPPVESPAATPAAAATPNSIPAPATSGFTPPVASSSGSGFQKPGEGAAGLSFAVSANWSLQPDPPSGGIDFPIDKPLRVKVPKESLRDGVAFPVAASPLVAVRTGNAAKGGLIVHDASTGRQVADAPSPGVNATIALAPDGSYLATTTLGSRSIEVHDLKTGKSLGTLSSDQPTKFQIAWLAVYSDRLIALSDVDKGMRMWELPSGKLVHDIKGTDKFNPSYGHAFSPGGRYVAVDGEFLEKRIDIYDMETGQVAGSITPQGKVKPNEIEALGFSRDGTQFAAIYGVDIYTAPARKYSRVMVWDLASGAVAADFELAPRLKEQLEPVYQCHTLESLPGSGRWLVQSLGIIDAVEGKLIYSFPKQKGVDLVVSRKVMGSNWLLAVTVDDGEPRLDQVKFSEEQLLAGAASAAAGGLAGDATLPPLTASEIQRAADAISINQWKAQPDPLTSSPIKDAIRLAAEGNPRDLVISRGVNPVVVVGAAIGENPDDREYQTYKSTLAAFHARGLEMKLQQPPAREIELLAFTSDGSPTAKLKIPFSAQLLGVSPGGRYAVVEPNRSNGRLDVYELKDSGGHVVGFRPFRGEADKSHRELKHAEFIDDEHLATLSMNYQLVVWKIPAAQAVWKLDEVRDFSISPGGKHLAALRGNILGAREIALFNTLTGDGLGTIAVEGKSQGMAFHPGGQWLAVSLDAGANKMIRIVDLSAGQTVEEFPVPVTGTSLAWTGEDYLLLSGTTLVSRAMQSVVWSYDAKDAVMPPSQVAERFTFLNRKVLHTIDVPKENVAARLDPGKLAGQAILKPGDAVELNVSISGDPLLQAIQAKAQSEVTQRLQAAKTQVGTSPIKLAVSVTLKDEGTETLSRIGDRSVTETVTRKSVNFSFAYSRNGKEIWRSDRRIGNLDQFLVRLNQGQSAQQAIDAQMIERAENLLGTMKLPGYIFNADAAKGLGSSALTD